MQERQDGGRTGTGPSLQQGWTYSPSKQWRWRSQGAAPTPQTSGGNTQQHSLPHLQPPSPAAAVLTPPHTMAAAETRLQPPERSSVLPVATGNEAATQQAHKLPPSTGHTLLPRCPETQVTLIQHQHPVPRAKVTWPPLPCPSLSLSYIKLTASPSPNLSSTGKGKQNYTITPSPVKQRTSTYQPAELWKAKCS